MLSLTLYTSADVVKGALVLTDCSWVCDYARGFTLFSSFFGGADVNF
jgi:hypothetical protein